MVSCTSSLFFPVSYSVALPLCVPGLWNNSGTSRFSQWDSELSGGEVKSCYLVQKRGEASKGQEGTEEWPSDPQKALDSGWARPSQRASGGVGDDSLRREEKKFSNNGPC